MSGGMGLLPDNIWLGDSRHLVISSYWRSSESLILVDIGAPNQVIRLPCPSGFEQGSGTLMDIWGHRVLAKYSTPNQPGVVLFLLCAQT